MWILWPLAAPCQYALDSPGYPPSAHRLPLLGAALEPDRAPFLASKKAASEHLKGPYQDHFLQRCWLPVECGQGMEQALCLLDRCGADIVTKQTGIDRADIHRRESYNLVFSPFPHHTRLIKDVHITVALAPGGGLGFPRAAVLIG